MLFRSIITGLVIASVALFLLSLLSKDRVIFYLAEACLGFGLAMRASLNYIMLNEVPAAERASTQGLLVIFISTGQLTGASLVGGILAAAPGNANGFGLAFISMAVLSSILVGLAFFLKNRKKELAAHQSI